MAYTKWDLMLLKYQRQNQQEWDPRCDLAELRRHLKETESTGTK